MLLNFHVNLSVCTSLTQLYICSSGSRHRLLEFFLSVVFWFNHSESCDKSCAWSFFYKHLRSPIHFALLLMGEKSVRKTSKCATAITILYNISFQQLQRYTCWNQVFYLEFFFFQIINSLHFINQMLTKLFGVLFLPYN